jgi:hypothetical protein
MLFLLACVNGVPDATPSIAIISPADEAVVCGSPLLVSAEVEGLVLVEPTEDPADNRPGEGHIDVTLNGQDAAMAWTEEIVISEVAAGEYQLKVELVNADHTAVVPYAGDLIYLTVTEDACE